MNKKILLFAVVFVFSMGIIGSVMASQIEGDVPIYKGWNLVYGLANPSQLDDWVTSEKVDIKAIYAFIPTTQEYARSYPNPENKKISLMDDDYLIKTAFWVYSDKETAREFNGRLNAVEYNLEETLPISEHQLYKGWNFVGVTPDMVGKNLGDLKGSCSIEKSYAWWPKRQTWDLVVLDDAPFNKNVLFQGVLIKVSNNCKLGTSNPVSTINPPSLPGLNNNSYVSNNVGLRKNIEDYYYNEFSYEECELNKAKNYTSATDCKTAWRCLASEYAKLVLESDLLDLKNYMASHGGESGSIYYSNKNLTIKDQLATKYKTCLSGKHNNY